MVTYAAHVRDFLTDNRNYFVFGTAVPAGAVASPSNIRFPKRQQTDAAAVAATSSTSTTSITPPAAAATTISSRTTRSQPSQSQSTSTTSIAPAVAATSARTTRSTTTQLSSQSQSTSRQKRALADVTPTNDHNPNKEAINKTVAFVMRHLERIRAPKSNPAVK